MQSLHCTLQGINDSHDASFFSARTLSDMWLILLHESVFELIIWSTAAVFPKGARPIHPAPAAHLTDSLPCL